MQQGFLFQSSNTIKTTDDYCIINIGSNGSGKSTFIDALTELIPSIANQQRYNNNQCDLEENVYSIRILDNKQVIIRIVEIYTLEKWSNEIVSNYINEITKKSTILMINFIFSPLEEDNIIHSRFSHHIHAFKQFPLCFILTNIHTVREYSIINRKWNEMQSLANIFAIGNKIYSNDNIIRWSNIIITRINAKEYSYSECISESVSLYKNINIIYTKSGINDLIHQQFALYHQINDSNKSIGYCYLIIGNRSFWESNYSFYKKYIEIYFPVIKPALQFKYNFI